MMDFSEDGIADMHKYYRRQRFWENIETRNFNVQSTLLAY